MSNFDELVFADNPDPRCPVVLVLDVSQSMEQVRPGQEISPIAALNDGLSVLVDELSRDHLANRRVEVAVVTCGAVTQVAADFATMNNFTLPELVAGGLTPLGEAINLGIDLLEERKRTYRANGVSYYRPWMMCITDGVPTDDTARARQRIADAEAARGLAFFAVAVDGADLDTLSQLSVREPMRLAGVKFAELFVWLSASQARVSASQVGDAVELPAPVGWAQV